MNKSVSHKKILGVLLIVGGLLLFFYSSANLAEEHNRSSVSVGGFQLEVLVADTPKLRTEGLSGRPSLESNEGMLFLFDAPRDRSFWMKDMNFPIDIIWIDENKKIVDITKGALPESYPDTFSPIEPSQYVLEVNSGLSDERGIKIGDIVQFSL